ncbi:unnamed protein product [Urochloa humidicola]
MPKALAIWMIRTIVPYIFLPDESLSITIHLKQGFKKIEPDPLLFICLEAFFVPVLHCSYWRTEFLLQLSCYMVHD